jgi:hypothetical protein
MRPIRNALSAKLERLIRRGMGPELAAAAGSDRTLTEVQQAVAHLHAEVFTWCGQLSAKAGEAIERSQALADTTTVLTAKLAHLTDHLRHVTNQLDALTGRIDTLTAQVADVVKLSQEGLSGLDELRETSSGIKGELQTTEMIVRADFDNVPFLRQQLIRARQEPGYEEAFTNPSPLVTVRIATYNRPELLVERAVASVLAQTYQNFEIVIVGDGCDDATATRLAEIADDRIRYQNMPHRGVYPADPVARWQVAGTPPVNRGAELARGTWIAPLDEDDLMSPDHVEVLLQAALENRYEVVYGRLLQRFSAERQQIIGRYPPEQGEFNFGGALYLRALRFFEWDPNAWVVDEPGDWRVCKQMLACGVEIGFLDRIVTTLNVTGPREDTTAPSD